MARIQLNLNQQEVADILYLLDESIDDINNKLLVKNESLFNMTNEQVIEHNKFIKKGIDNGYNLLTYQEEINLLRKDRDYLQKIRLKIINAKGVWNCLHDDYEIWENIA